MNHTSLEPGGSGSLGLKKNFCGMEMALPEDQSSSAGAGIKRLNRVEETVS